MDVADAQAQAMSIPRHITTGKPYPLKAILAFGMNHRMWPDSAGMARSLEKLNFFVNVDIFMTDTCKYADIVLPACTSMERSELRCYPQSYAIYTQPAVAPLYESRSDGEIIFDLATRLCPEDALLAAGYEACLDWILEPSGMTLAELPRRQSPAPRRQSPAPRRRHPPPAPAAP
jgi:anaerobic selenocysteine-containing dehydrogenase